MANSAAQVPGTTSAPANLGQSAPFDANAVERSPVLVLGTSATASPPHEHARRARRPSVCWELPAASAPIRGTGPAWSRVDAAPGTTVPTIRLDARARCSKGPQGARAQLHSRGVRRTRTAAPWPWISGPRPQGAAAPRGARPEGPEGPERPKRPKRPEGPKRPERPKGPKGPKRPKRPKRSAGDDGQRVEAARV